MHEKNYEHRLFCLFVSTKLLTAQESYICIRINQNIVVFGLPRGINQKVVDNKLYIPTHIA